MTREKSIPPHQAAKINIRKNVQILSDLVLLNRKLSRHYTELDLALPC